MQAGGIGVTEKKPQADASLSRECVLAANEDMLKRPNHTSLPAQGGLLSGNWLT
jgi:hypothetical protein